MEENYFEIIQLIKFSRASAIKAVNTELINLYWNVGGYISNQLKKSNWGEKAVDELAAFIKLNHPELKGFNRRGLSRMKQFYEVYAAAGFVSPVMTEIEIRNNQNFEIVSSQMTHLNISDMQQNELFENTPALLENENKDQS